MRLESLGSQESGTNDNDDDESTRKTFEINTKSMVAREIETEKANIFTDPFKKKNRP